MLPLIQMRFVLVLRPNSRHGTCRLVPTFALLERHSAAGKAGGPRPADKADLLKLLRELTAKFVCPLYENFPN
jgi:hypothetical protein